MPICPPEFKLATDALAPLLVDLPAKLIAIDGRDGAGKTTLGRYLAWYFNVTLIETDLFVVPNSSFTYRLDEIIRIVNFRLNKPRPVIVEGVAVLDLLKQIGRCADFHIFMRNLEYEGSLALASKLENYELSYNPAVIADLVLEASH